MKGVKRDMGSLSLQVFLHSQRHHSIIMFSKIITFIVVSSVWLGVWGAPAAQVLERGCHEQEGSACLRIREGTFLERTIN